MTEEIIRTAVFACAIPLVIGLIGSWILSRRLSEDPTGDRHGWRISVVGALAIFLAAYLINGWPTEKWQYVVWLPVVGCGTGLLAAFSPRSRSTRLLIVAHLGAAIGLIMWPVIEKDPTWVKVCIVAAPVVLLVGMDLLAARLRGPLLPIALGLSFGGAGAVILASGAITQAQPVVAGGFVLAGVGLAGLLGRRADLADGAVFVFAPFLAVALLVRYLYMQSEGGDVPAAAFMLPALAPLVLWLGEIPPLSSLGRGPRNVVRLALVLALCGAGAFLARPGGDGAADDDPYADMYRDMMGIRISSPVP